MPPKSLEVGEKIGIIEVDARTSRTYSEVSPLTHSEKRPSYAEI
jgi:hypothetical protein